MLRQIALAVLMLLTIPFSYAADGWEITKKGEGYLLTHSAKKVAHSLEFNGTPLLQKIQTEKLYTFVDYESGEYGTGHLVKISRRVIFDQKNKVLGDYVYKYESSDNQEDQPVWKVDPVKREISIDDPDSFIKKTLKY